MPHLVVDPTTGVYMAEPVANTLAVAFSAALFAFRFSRAMKQIEQA